MKSFSGCEPFNVTKERLSMNSDLSLKPQPVGIQHKNN
jgi:hypothetical protein